MPAYNFSPEFADDVEHRRKTQTIRMTDKGAKVGDPVFLYTGQRTKQSRSLGTSTLVDIISIQLNDNSAILDGDFIYHESVLNLLARSDGFENYQSMTEWFRKKYNLESLTKTPFNGFLHVWT
jgi:hypothetical protein